MESVTLNCSRASSLGRPPARAPRPLSFPAKAHARHAPRPDQPSPPDASPFPAAGHRAFAAELTAMLSSRKSPDLRRRRRGTAAFPGTRSGTDAAAPARPPRPCVSLPSLRSRAPVPPLLECCARCPRRWAPLCTPHCGADVLGLRDRPPPPRR